MNTLQLWLKQLSKHGLFLMMGASISACSAVSWKEEVLLHDGNKIMVSRSQSHGGRREIGQPSPIKEQSITFTEPSSNKSITWRDEFSEEIGHSNFNLLALHILNGIPFIIASPDGCLSYNKWGRPNPPYVIFKYDDNAWRRIQQSEFPAEFKNINLVINTLAHEIEISSQSPVRAELVKKLNGSLEQPEYKTILREALPNVGGECIKTNYYSGVGWLSPDWFTDQPSLEACFKFCNRKKISTKTCPCNSIFNEE